MIYLPLLLLLFFIGPALAAIPVRRSVTLSQHTDLIAGCILYGILPLLLTFGGVQLALFFGCESVGMGTMSFTCPQQPWLGNIISFMTFAYGFAIFTIPSAFVGTVGLVITLVKRFKKSEDQISGSTRNRFTRSRRHKVIAGVCGAIAQRFRISVLAVRIVTVALSIAMPIIFLLLYFWIWLAFPLSSSTDNT
ncbi:MAG: PspC domain-containing protein [Moorea sp. SIO3I7]|uniref:PspC domain-containing protein n=1 Tax=unclassified Moorena TaxID=2683338 RepID=UPI0013C87D07|nr:MULTISPECIES: PspC domain-containing protein [unclassified Moorena]NEO03896.1 PspC domain-containing protein [Moorena sp. SIO3I7]NEO17878.1 PspC domain-containing protein [Moorena sp. SIO4A5]NEP25561.1 PspC domain-containing protein [Moorena sp. SIO3I6]NEQ59874.1 PspC domain-containing protein [Moorena sp. SIO4A1]